MNVSISAPSSSAPAAPGLYSATTAEPWSKPVVVTAGRGVLDGAFAVLDALADADEGLGLTALARVSGLAKSSAHRLSEQLVTLGALQCFAHRYYVGPADVAHRAAQATEPGATALRPGAGPYPCRAIACHRVAADP